MGIGKFQFQTILSNGVRLLGYHRSRMGKQVSLMLLVISPDNTVLGSHTVRFGNNKFRDRNAKDRFKDFENFCKSRGIDRASWTTDKEVLIAAVPRLIQNNL